MVFGVGDFRAVLGVAYLNRLRCACRGRFGEVLIYRVSCDVLYIFGGRRGAVCDVLNASGDILAVFGVGDFCAVLGVAYLNRLRCACRRRFGEVLIYRVSCDVLYIFGGRRGAVCDVLNASGDILAVFGVGDFCAVLGVAYLNRLRCACRRRFGEVLIYRVSCDVLYIFGGRRGAVCDVLNASGDILAVFGVGDFRAVLGVAYINRLRCACRSSFSCIQLSNIRKDKIHMIN